MRSFTVTLIVAAGLFQAGTTIAAADWAIAVGQNGGARYAYGTAYNYTSSREARSAALSNCRSEGRNCQVVADGAGSCVAVAFSTVNNGYGWSSGDDKREASHGAMQKCHEFADSECEIRATFCDE